MTSQELWNRYCEYFTYFPEVGIALDVSRMRFDESFLQKMTPRVQAAFDAMSQLERGAIANPDENRRVGHYWLRTPSLAPDAALTSMIESGVTRIKEFAHQVHTGLLRGEWGEPFRHVLLLGIGGSALGPQLVADALWHENRPLNIFFGDNTDPDGFARLVAELDGALGETLTIVTSKSGGTPETRNAQLEIAAAYERAGLVFAKHAVAVTCEGSKLDALASENHWLARFPMWDWVGGRTSLFSAVGLLPAALLGIEIDHFIRGGASMDVLTRSHDLKRNPAMMLALMWFHAGNGRGEKDMVVLPYRDRLALFSKYLQQLVMESLGKERDLNGNTVHQGIAVYGNKGSTDQHAYIQQLRDGLSNFFATFIEVLSDSDHRQPIFVEPDVTSGDFLSGFMAGTRRALFENGRDSITLSVDKLDAHSLGALIALYDRAVGFYASLVNINAYHQPGVEAGKKAASEVIALTREVLAQLRRNPGRAFTAEQMAQSVGKASESEGVFKILTHLAAHPLRKIERSDTRHPCEATFAFRG